MRLGQLARKLSLRPSQLVDFLAASNIESEEGSNTRLDDSHVEMIVQHFAPGSLVDILKPASAEEQISAVDTEVEVPTETEVVITEAEKAAVSTQTNEEQLTSIIESEPRELTAEEHEVIRVQKIELAGLKVLGKIELTETKKKEKSVEGETASPELNADRRERRSYKSGKEKSPRDREQHKRRNPIELQRQREAREQEERRKAELERDKEKRKQHYNSKVKQASLQPKRVKPLKTASVQKKQPVDNRPKPKTLLGKFLRWWTT